MKFNLLHLSVGSWSFLLSSISLPWYCVVCYSSGSMLSSYWKALWPRFYTFRVFSGVQYVPVSGKEMLWYTLQGLYRTCVWFLATLSNNLYHVSADFEVFHNVYHWEFLIYACILFCRFCLHYCDDSHSVYYCPRRISHCHVHCREQAALCLKWRYFECYSHPLWGKPALRVILRATEGIEIKFDTSTLSIYVDAFNWPGNLSANKCCPGCNCGVSLTVQSTLHL